MIVVPVKTMDFRNEGDDCHRCWSNWDKGVEEDL